MVAWDRRVLDGTKEGDNPENTSEDTKEEDYPDNASEGTSASQRSRSSEDTENPHWSS
jgi:hypothetical protein